MDVDGKVAIVTGAGAGIGAALAEELVRRGARVVLGDVSPRVDDVAAALNDAAGREVAAAHRGDVAAPSVIEELIGLAGDRFGGAQLYFANAGIIGVAGLDATESDWDTSIDVKLGAHIRAAQMLVPRWVAAGEGYFVSTASAAGLLTQIGSATYTVTKHAAVGFAEWLNITHGDAGVRASCLCPMGVDTELLYAGRETGDPLGVAATNAVLAAGEVLAPQQVAAATLDTVEGDEACLILPHADVLDMMRQKASDHERWLRGMRRFQSSLTTPTADTTATDTEGEDR